MLRRAAHELSKDDVDLIELAPTIINTNPTGSRVSIPSGRGRAIGPRQGHRAAAGKGRKKRHGGVNLPPFTICVR
jgi:hypothetical protein